ncbi:MAG: hypothetical protein JRE81_10345, partial [Deltaproteobacteria bacterium]|nr:hypothetical protein [Deltaproteobacteria bacterium]
PSGLRLVLEVAVPDAREARVRLPIKASGRDWVLDDSASAAAQWEQAMEQRRQALERAEIRGDVPDADRIRAELAWLARLRAAPEPVLEPADDGEEAR